MSEEQTNRNESRIENLLMAEEFGEARAEILGYGDRALPTLERVLTTRPEDQLDELRISRALFILADIGGDSSALLPLMQQHLTADSPMIRRQAVRTLASIGDMGDILVLAAMLYDPDAMVRMEAVRALGSIGEGSALRALDIWRKQAAEADKRRPEQERWLTPSMLRRLEEAEAAIRERPGEDAGE